MTMEKESRNFELEITGYDNGITVICRNKDKNRLECKEVATEGNEAKLIGDVIWGEVGPMIESDWTGASVSIEIKGI